MAASLIGTINDYLTPNVIDKASSFLHESPTNTSKAMSGIIPTLLGGITHMASSQGGANRLMSLLSSGGYDGSNLNNLASWFGSGGSATAGAIHQGESLLSTLFGNKVDSVTSLVSGFSGVSKGSAASLMAMAAPVVMGAIGKSRTTQGLNSSGLANMLASQKPLIDSALPPDLATVPVTEKIEKEDYSGRGLQSVTVKEVSEPSGMRWWPVALLVLAALGLLAYLFARPRPGGVTTATAPAMTPVRLCSGQSATLPGGSLTYNLARYLTGSSAAGQTFTFDDLNFASSTVQLTPASTNTVNELAVVLKACPNAHVQLVGYTDNSGDPAANQALSTARANRIRDLLVAQGVPADRLTTAGYGQDRPVASNDTAEGRAQNRRIELVVTQK